MNAAINPVSRWAHLMKALPLTTGLLLVAAVWAAGAVWSFSEQRDFAAARGFDLPALLPLTIDGLALSLAVVAWSAALDGRAAVQARIGTFIAIAASATSNGTWAATRTHGDLIAVTLAAGVPLAAAVAFETLLAELRKGVHRRRGLPAPIAVAGPRIIRLTLAPWPTFRDWRTHVLNLTAPGSTPTPGQPPITISVPHHSRDRSEENTTQIAARRTDRRTTIRPKRPADPPLTISPAPAPRSPGPATVPAEPTSHRVLAARDSDLARAREAIAAGQLPEHPTAASIRALLAISPAYARATRDALTVQQSTPQAPSTTRVPSPTAAARTLRTPDHDDQPGPAEEMTEPLFQHHSEDDFPLDNTPSMKSTPEAPEHESSDEHARNALDVHTYAVDLT